VPQEIGVVLSVKMMAETFLEARRLLRSIGADIDMNTGKIVHYDGGPPKLCLDIEEENDEHRQSQD